MPDRPSRDELVAELRAEGRGLLAIEVYHPDGTHGVIGEAAISLEAFNPDTFFDMVMGPAVEGVIDRMRKWSTNLEETP